MLRVETNTLKHSGSWTAWPWRWHYDRSQRREPFRCSSRW